LVSRPIEIIQVIQSEITAERYIAESDDVCFCGTADNRCHYCCGVLNAIHDEMEFNSATRGCNRPGRDNPSEGTILSAALSSITSFYGNSETKFAPCGVRSFT
jgi:hypothetical protein